MKLKYLFIIAFVIFSVGIVSATTIGDIATFKKDQQSNLFQICDTCNYVNLTSIELPNKTLVNIDELMTKTFNTFNYTYTFDEVGDGHYSVCGDKGGSINCEAIPYLVTGSGISDTIGFYILILILSLGIIFFGIWKEDVIISLLGSFGLYFLGLYSIFNGIAGIRDATTTWAFSIIILGIAFYISVRAAMELIDA